ncbi:MAG: transport system ATP-binding/permease protein [Thermoleophilaceae bacterium]|nr:transport system ATP-binding/permease protein [Thermoleophilaceae bacterium]
MTEGVVQENVVLLYEGARHPIGPEGVTLGRSADNDVPLPVEKASRRHARIARGNGGLTLEDLGSTHGTLLNGRPLEAGRPQPLGPGDRIEIDGAVLRILAGGETRFEPGEVGAEPLPEESVAFDGERLTIGRQEGCDLVLPDPNVSRMHAELVRTGDGTAELVDLGSSAGTRVNGVQSDRAPLAPGSTIGIGPYQVHFDGSRLMAHDSRTELRLTAHDVAVDVGEKRILQPVSLAVEPGELVVLIGASGAGKSTLLKVLAGVNPPSDGDVTVNDEPLAARLTDVGYVPQDEIVHPELTVREALRYAARLRLPQDTSAEEIDATVERVLAELSLTEHADTKIGSLSGGQRKRTGVATELLSRPSLLFLDEPTTGLDPSLEGRLMRLLRELADGGRGVVVVTHATASLGLADRVVVMGAGGFRVFEGTPAEALAFFGVDSFEAIYDALDETPPEELRERFEARAGTVVPEPAPAGARAARPAGRGRGFLSQARVLTARQAMLFKRDTKNMALLLGQVPVLGALDGLIFGTHIFDRPGGSPGDAIQLMFLLVLGPIWFGSLTAAREIVKERALRDREAAIGVRLDAYLFSKVVVVGAVVTVQSLGMTAIVLGLRPVHEKAGVYAAVIGLLVITAIAATAMGLLVSALVSSEDQAMSIIPLVLIPQFLFAGAIVPVARMLQPFKAMSYLDPSQWALASIGTRLHFNERMAGSPEFAQVNRYGTHFFDVSLLTGAGALVAFFAVFLGLTAVVLRRREAAQRR